MQFKLANSFLLAILPSVLALPNAAPVSGPAEPGSLIERSCSYSTGCVSEQGASAGKYCGFCTQVRGTFNPTDIYQVNGGTGSSSCCDYGHSTSCAQHWPSVSPNVYVNCANDNRGY